MLTLSLMLTISGSCREAYEGRRYCTRAIDQRRNEIGKNIYVLENEDSTLLKKRYKRMRDDQSPDVNLGSTLSMERS